MPLQYKWVAMPSQAFASGTPAVPRVAGSACGAHHLCMGGYAPTHCQREAGGPRGGGFSMRRAPPLHGRLRPNTLPAGGWRSQEWRVQRAKML
jgi:hypothetical protein